MTSDTPVSEDYRNVLTERAIHAEQRASENRVSAIVAAMDAATAQVLGQVVDTAEAQAVSQGCGTSAAPAATRTTTSTTTTTLTPR